MAYSIDYINTICSDMGGIGGHAYEIDGLNEICTLIGATAGHKYNIDALNAICAAMGYSAGHKYNIDALNAIYVGGTYIYEDDAWQAIQIGSKLNVFYVRPTSVTAYGTEDGKSYTNAFNGFASIDWAAITPGAVLYVCGTHVEQLTVGANGQANRHIKIKGNYTADPAIINIEGTAETHCILVDSKNYITCSDFSSLIGSGKGACVRLQGTAGSTGLGHTIVFDKVSVTRNYASTNGDGFSLDNTAQAKFYDIAADKCREEIPSAGSHQCLTTHADSSAKIYGATFSDSNYWFVPTLNSKIEAHNITASGALQYGIQAGLDTTAEAYVKVYDSTLTFDVGAKIIGAPNSAAVATKLYLEGCTINSSSATVSYSFSDCEFNACTFNLNDPNWNFYQSEGELKIHDCTFNLTQTGAYTFRADAYGYLNAYNNSFNITSCGYLFTFSNALAPTKSIIYNNTFKNISGSSKILWVKDNSYAPLFANNVSYNATSGGILIDLDHTGDEAVGFQLVYKNNIAYNVADIIQPAAGAVYTENNNCNYNSENLGGTGDIITYPLFVVAGTNFHLQSGSPAIGAGEDLSAHFTTDKDGNTRVAWDIGAYEYQG